MPLIQYLSVADNANDPVLLHVSASSKRQEWRNENSSITKRTEQRTLTHSDSCGLSGLCFYALKHLVEQIR